MKKVSVIIPFYKHVDWLIEAVESVFSQTYSNIEVIVINDGSSENIDGFIKQYGSRIIYHYQNNAGPAAARNWGILHASGEYIAFEDSDDIWLPHKLEYQIAFMEERGIMWSHTGYYNWWPECDNKVIAKNHNEYGNVLLRRRVSSYMATPSVVVRADVFKTHNLCFPIESRIGEDDRLYTKLASLYPLGLVQTPLVKVRMRSDNSYTRAVPRFNLRYNNYIRWKEEGISLPLGIHFIYKIYGLYVKVLGHNSTPLKEVIAKCLWTMPYGLERVYLLLINTFGRKDDTYVLKST